ncbi:site-specific integrase [Pseudomonas sp. Irchel 3E13]|uniref:tyrosine-type recombinase/integrase n=1 Tax=Pseudomonas sp. Irchel 3E13 TaxID=2008975 RepID=UPI000BA37E25|nr:site-specific integrase [Pseudomonas sp. Irchel 3E13]
MTPYKVKVVGLEGGERFPILCERQSGLPVFRVNLWVLTELRAAHLAVNTIQQAIQSVMILLVVLDQLKVDLDARLNNGKFLTLGEVELISRCCKLPAAEIEGFAQIMSGARGGKPEALAQQVSVTTVSIRLYYIKRYLSWVATGYLIQVGATHENFLALEKLRVSVLDSIQARIPSSSSYSSFAPRVGLSEHELRLVQQYVEPGYELNPWKNDRVQKRNYLIIRWLLSLGVRRGELLGIKISDVNFQTNEILIARRAGDPADPRRRQPCTKTSARLLALDPGLADLTRSYVMSIRRSVPGARRHEYLWVALGTGKPMSLANLNKIFKTLRMHCQELPQDLSPHVLRHTWNELFSEVVDQKGISAEIEQKIRSRMMGWSETSEMAKVYNQRHIRRKAAEVSLEMQARLGIAGGSDEKWSE